MRRILAVLAALATMSVAGVFPALGQSSVVTRIGLDQTRVIRTREPVGGIAVGNTNIVAVALHDLQTLILTGRSPGVTNLMVMDASGRVMRETRLIVPVSSSDGVSVTRGGQTTEYICDSVSCALRTDQR